MRSWRTWGALALMVTCAVGFAGNALAEPNERDRANARQLVAIGDHRIATADIEGALEAYRAADVIMDVPSTGILVVDALVMLGRLREARDKCKAIAASPAPPDEPEPFTQARARASELATELDVRIPRVTITVVNPSGGEVITVNGKEVAADAGELELDPGKHEAVVVAPGFKRRARAFELSEKERTTLSLTLERDVATPVVPVPPVPDPAPDPEPDPTPDPSEPISGLRIASYVSFGVAGVGMLVGSITGAMSLSTIDDARAQCPNDQCPDAVRDDVDSGFALAHASTATFILGGAALGVGIVTLVLSLGDDDAPTSDAAFQPIVGPGTFGLRGRF